MADKAEMLYFGNGVRLPEVERYFRDGYSTEKAKFECNTSWVSRFITETLGGKWDSSNKKYFDTFDIPFRGGTIKIGRNYDSSEDGKFDVGFVGEVTEGLEDSVIKLFNRFRNAEAKVIANWVWMSSIRYGHFPVEVEKFLTDALNPHQN